MKEIQITLLLLWLSATVFGQQIDEKQSIVDFEVSNMAINTVEGTFSGMRGDINFNKNDLSNSKFNVCIDVKTVDTDSKGRDDHLLKEDFFDASKFPTICFKSTSISKTADGYLATGKLTMRGVTKEVKIPFTYSNNTFKGALTVNRLDYNIGEDVGGFMVGKEIEMVVTCVTK